MSRMKIVDISHNDLKPKYRIGLGGRKYKVKHEQRLPDRHVALSKAIHRIYKDTTILSFGFNPQWRKKLLKKFYANGKNAAIREMQNIWARGYTHVIVDDHLRDILVSNDITIAPHVPEIFHESDVEQLLKFLDDL